MTTTGADATSTVCHVVTHVHWDREWYRPFEAFRARLVELAEHVCTQLDDGRMSAFHLDGQTIVLADVAALRPDLADRLRAHAAAGRLTVGPWHVLADNQLVSGENLIRNLLTARRHAPADGALAQVGYSPDAFGHPADLPRVLRGFGMDTALVWRGAPDGVARFRWRSPDGSEVFAVNQGYHAAELLWGDDTQAAASRVADFLAAERARLPHGPWLLMNGGDHLAPTDPTHRLAKLSLSESTPKGTVLHQSSLEDFFTAARAAAEQQPLPLIDGELRHPAGYLTFILPGTLSARTDLKQANTAGQNLLERWAEPLIALHAPHSATLRADLDHAWDLLLRNAPHDSLCGCSVDEVHRENAVRYERVHQVGEHILLRALADAGIDVRAYGDRPEEHTDLVIINPHPYAVQELLSTEILTAPGRYPTEIAAADGTLIPFEYEELGQETSFEADLDLLPDSRPSLRHRLWLRTPSVPGLGRTVLRIRLSSQPPVAARAFSVEERRMTASDGGHFEVQPDASLSWHRADGTVLPEIGLLTDGGDSGDTYNYDPPVHDRLIRPRLTACTARRSAVREVLDIDAVLELPIALAPERDRRADQTRAVPVRISVARWHDDPLLRWHIEVDNTVHDHRLRLHVPTAAGSPTWTGDAHWSLIERPVVSDLGPLPQERGREAVCGSAPVQSLGAVGRDDHRTALFAPGLPEMRALAGDETASGAQQEIVVTLLRSVGWLSRFDLRSRTTGAGPMLAVPDAQMTGRHAFTVAMAFGSDIAADRDLARTAARYRTPLRAWQARPGTYVADAAGGLHVEGGCELSALKPAENGAGCVLRLSNPVAEPVDIMIHAPGGTRLVPSRLDEHPTGEPERVAGMESGRWTLEPYSTLTLRILFEGEH
ncbi:hypothetical protein [Streptomyces sp. NPDC001914]|uniref:glycoside hydrolase family 38 N-terminal domain-containing protein n=1 Tax=Streptomyces sp. NPDC001914 TaxID=3364623 RepID=UPI00368F1226